MGLIPKMLEKIITSVNFWISILSFSAKNRFGKEVS